MEHHHNNLIGDIAVLDPVFNSGLNNLQVLEQLKNHGYHGKLSLQCRLEMIKPEFLTKLKTQGAQVTLEFGLQIIHPEEQTMIGRKNNLSKVQKVLQDCNALELDYEVSLIFGLPKQTLESFKASIQFCRDNKAGKIRAFPLMLLHGTELFHQKEALGLVESTEFHRLAWNGISSSCLRDLIGNIGRFLTWFNQNRLELMIGGRWFSWLTLSDSD